MSGVPASRRILPQVEYYLSDRNLAKDDFFREEIAKEDGWVPLTVLLNCNRVKALTSKTEDVAAAVSESKVLELNEGREKVRRVKPYVPSSAEISIDFDRVVIGVTGVPAGVRWNVVKDAFEAVANVAFVSEVTSSGGAGGTASKKRGRDSDNSSSTGEWRVAVNCGGKTAEDVLAQLTAANIQVNGKDVTLSLVEGDAAKAFWAEMAAKDGKKGGATSKPASKPTTPSKRGSGGAGGSVGNPALLTKVFELPSGNYNGIQAASDRFRSIIKATPAGTVLTDAYLEDAKTVLCYHPHAVDKLANAVSFTVGSHPEYPDTQCLFVNKSDGSKADFSWKKSLENWAEKGTPVVDPATVTLTTDSSKSDSK